MITSKAVDLVSGPGGLASFLRRRQLGARLAGPSLPLDVGVSRDIPAAIRHAVILRDQHCRWTGGCDQPAAACEVHHLTHKADGGKTSVPRRAKARHGLAQRRGTCQRHSYHDERAPPTNARSRTWPYPAAPAAA